MNPDNLIEIRDPRVSSSSPASIITAWSTASVRHQARRNPGAGGRSGSGQIGHRPFDPAPAALPVGQASVWHHRIFRARPADAQREDPAAYTRQSYCDDLPGADDLVEPAALHQQINEVLGLHKGLTGKVATQRTLELLELVGIPEPHKPQGPAP